MFGNTSFYALYIKKEIKDARGVHLIEWHKIWMGELCALWGSLILAKLEFLFFYFFLIHNFIHYII